MSEVVTVADLKKRLRLVVNTLTKDYDGFNHLDAISRLLMEIEGHVDYISDKLEMRADKARGVSDDGSDREDDSSRDND